MPARDKILSRMAVIVTLVLLAGCGPAAPTATPIPPTSASTLADTPLPPTSTPTAISTESLTPSPLPQGGATRVWEKDNSVMVYVPAGAFWMGSASAEIEDAVAACVAV